MEERGWLGGGSGIALMSLDEPSRSRVQAIETNSYPFSTPMLSEDGDMLVYLSDADSTDVTDTEVRFSRSSGGGFPDGTAIPDGADGFSGYGDSAPDFDGTGAFAGAVWLREAATLGLKAGTELNEGQQTILLNGLEVMASLWNGREWVTTRLTDNGSQEFDPVIAAADGKAIAVWRAVQTDESAFDFTQNRILCRIYDGTKWSDQTYTLYNGSAGEVTAIVDFAHNGLSFEKMFDTVALEYPGSRVSVVFGTPGGKAFNRRKDMGEISGKRADRIFLVPDDPGNEDPQAICEEIGGYMVNRCVDVNRRINPYMEADYADLKKEMEDILEKWDDLAQDAKEIFCYGRKFMVKNPDASGERLLKAFGTFREDPAFETMTSMRNVDVMVPGSIIEWKEDDDQDGR